MARNDDDRVSRWWWAVLALLVLALWAVERLRASPAPAPDPAVVPAVAEARSAPADAPLRAFAPLPEDLPRPFRGTSTRLANGMTVVLIEDHGAPTVAARVAFRVGSADDPPGLAGLAHLVEHLVFAGTPRLGTEDWAEEAPLLDELRELSADPDADPVDLAEVHALADGPALPGELSHLLDELGASGVNASTSVDFTSFQALLPKHVLEPWAVAMAEALREPVFRGFLRERDVVDEERRLRDRCAGGVLSLLQTLFAGHPYGSPIVGTPDSLDALHVAALEEFHARWYTPDNAVLVLVGDLDPHAARAIAERTFGTWTTPPAPRRGAPAEIDHVPGEHRLPGGEQAQIAVAWPLRALEPGDVEALRVFAKYAEAAVRRDTRGPASMSLVDFDVVPLRHAGLLVAHGWCSEPARCDRAIRDVLRGGAELVRPHHIVWAANQAWVTALRKVERHDAQADAIVDAWSRGVSLDALWLETLRVRQLSPDAVREVVERVLVADTSAALAGSKSSAPMEKRPRRRKSAFRSTVDEEQISQFYADVLAIPVPDPEPAWRVHGRDWTEALDGRVVAVPNPANSLFQADLVWRRGWRELPMLCAALRAWDYDAFQLDGAGWGRALAAAGVSVVPLCDWEQVVVRVEGPGEFAPAAIARVEAGLLAPEVSGARKHTYRALLQADEIGWRTLLYGPLRSPTREEFAQLDAATMVAAIRELVRTPPDLRYTGPHEADALAPLLYGGARGEPDPLPDVVPIDHPEVESRLGDRPGIAAVRIGEPFDPSREGLYALYETWLTGRTGIVTERVRDGRGATYGARVEYQRGRWPGEPNLTVVRFESPVAETLEETVLGALSETSLGERWERVRESTHERVFTRHVPFRELPAWIAEGLDRGFPGDRHATAWQQLEALSAEDFAAFLRAEAARPVRMRVTRASD